LTFYKYMVIELYVHIILHALLNINVFLNSIELTVVRFFIILKYLFLTLILL
jgi:hypothetical protein